MRRYLLLLLSLSLSLPAYAQNEVFYQLNQKVAQSIAKGRYDESLALSKEAIECAKKEFGPYHDNVIMSLNTLAEIYASQGKYSKAEKTLKRVLAIRTLAIGDKISFKSSKV